MSSTMRSSSGLRRSRFHNPNDDTDDPPQPPPPTTPLSLTEFTKESHKRLLHRLHQKNDAQDEVAVIEAADTTKRRSDAEKNDGNDEVTMAQCIALLEPHLTAFRERCDAAAALRMKHRAVRQSKHNTVAVDSEDTLTAEDEVPSQLIRLARFFAWRWLPVKKALLRPPPDEREVEVCLTYRIRLAEACWKKGLLAGAEYESLSASFSKKRAAIDDDSGGGKRYKSDNNNWMERVRLSLMRLPSEVVTNEKAALAWRHVHEIVIEFCKSRTKNNDASSDGNDDDGSMEQIADWMLTSWNALMLSQSMDASSPSTLPAIEHQFANLLSNAEPTTSHSLLTQAVSSRIDDLLSPNNLKRLNGIHIFSLGKLLARYHCSHLAEVHISKSVRKCATLGGMTCLEQLSRLVATYICSLRGIMIGEEKNHAIITDDRITGFEKRISSELDSAIANLGDQDQKKDKARMQSFLNVVLSAAAHLCSP